jgi:hypothetical protein
MAQSNSSLSIFISHRILSVFVEVNSTNLQSNERESLRNNLTHPVRNGEVLNQGGKVKRH